MILNRQKRLVLRLAAVRAFVQRLRAALRLGRRDFNVCFVDDREIKQLNAVYLGRNRPTDVLSFPWVVGEGPALPRGAGDRPCPKRAATARDAEFANFLGDVLISVETARRNACLEGHSTLNEIRWLILHGLLHLLGYDHEQDRGEMTSLELSLRERLGIAGQAKERGRVARQTGRKVRACR